MSAVNINQNNYQSQVLASDEASYITGVVLSVDGMARS